MRHAFKVASITLALAGSGSLSASAAPVGGAAPTSLVEQAQFYWNDHQYCFYEDGWRGPGWYMCGYAWRRGYGWGGGRGWDRRFHDDGRREYREGPRDHRDMDRRRDYDRDRGDRRGGEGGMR